MKYIDNSEVSMPGRPCRKVRKNNNKKIMQNVYIIL